MLNLYDLQKDIDDVDKMLYNKSDIERIYLITTNTGQYFKKGILKWIKYIEVN